MEKILGVNPTYQLPPCMPPLDLKYEVEFWKEGTGNKVTSLFPAPRLLPSSLQLHQTPALFTFPLHSAYLLQEACCRPNTRQSAPDGVQCDCLWLIPALHQRPSTGHPAFRGTVGSHTMAFYLFFLIIVSPSFFSNKIRLAYNGLQVADLPDHQIHYRIPQSTDELEKANGKNLEMTTNESLMFVLFSL
jgi:hypothetical protein